MGISTLGIGDECNELINVNNYVSVYDLAIIGINTFSNTTFLSQ